MNLKELTSVWSRSLSNIRSDLYNARLEHVIGNLERDAQAERFLLEFHDNLAKLQSWVIAEEVSGLFEDEDEDEEDFDFEEDEDEEETLAEAILDELGDRNWSTAKLAEESGVGRRSIEGILDGTTKRARESTVERLQFALGVELPRY